MNYKAPGLVSLLLVFDAIIIAVISLYRFSPLSAVIYLLLLPPVFLNVLYIYCRRCPHVVGKDCRHVLFGPIVARLFKVQNAAPYSAREILSALLPLIVYLGLPQYALFQSLPLFAAFWVLVFAGAVVIQKAVCPRCRNTNCVMCKAR